MLGGNPGAVEARERILEELNKNIVAVMLAPGAALEAEGFSTLRAAPGRLFRLANIAKFGKKCKNRQKMQTS